jgi:RNA polymerase sigma-70 factor (ECF subfamily)
MQAGQRSATLRAVSKGADDARDDESEFVARLQARDELAFTLLLELYQRRVFALIYRMLGQRALAEEVTQDTFVQVFKSIDSFRGESKLSTWLFRVAVNLTKNKMKAHARRPGAGPDVHVIAEHTALSRAEGVSVGSVGRPDELLEGVQLERVVNEAMSELEPEFRRLVILRDVEDLSYEEIAEITDLPRGTVKSRIHRGRAQLRARVERMLGMQLVKGKGE